MLVNSIQFSLYVAVTGYSSLQQAPVPLYGNSHAMGSLSHSAVHGTICYPVELTFPLYILSRIKLVLDIATPEGCTAELT